MDLTTITILGASALAAVVIAAVWFGHHLGTNAAAVALLAKAKTDAQQLGAAVTNDLRQVAAQAQTPGFLHSAEQFLEHPVTSTENALAQHHLSTIKSAATALWDDSKSLAKIAEGQAEIEARAALRAQAAAVVAKLSTPS